MDFWSGFLDCAIKNGVKPDHARWYVEWANRFAKAVQGVPLRDRCVEDVRVFLDDLKAAEEIAPWQVEQARKALRLLYETYLRIDPATMPRKRADSHRDAVTRPHELAQRHGNLLTQLNTALLSAHYSPRTREAYIGWARRFITFHAMNAPEALDAGHIKAYLDYLATDRRVASSTQNQALNALVYLFGTVLGREPGDFSDFVRAKTPLRRPAVLSVQEAGALVAALGDPYRAMALVMYGSGLRIRECLGLQVRDLGFEEGTIHVRGGKGAKDRITILAHSAIEPLKAQLARVRPLYEEDRLHDTALAWETQYVFPSESLRVDPATRRVFRMPLNHNTVHRALQDTARRIGIAQKVTPHVLRHAFASHLAAQGCHLQTVQELLGHRHLSTTMIYTHPMNRPGAHPVSPLDGLSGVGAPAKDST